MPTHESRGPCELRQLRVQCSPLVAVVMARRCLAGENRPTDSRTMKPISPTLVPRGGCGAGDLRAVVRNCREVLSCI